MSPLTAAAYGQDLADMAHLPVTACRPQNQVTCSEVQVDQHSLWLGVGSQSMLSKLSADSALLGPAEGGVLGHGADAVDANNPRVKGRAQSQGAVDVLREDACHQAVLAVVGLGDDFLLCLELVDCDDRPKDLVFVDRCAIFRAGENGWLDIVALRDTDKLVGVWVDHTMLSSTSYFRGKLGTSFLLTSEPIRLPPE